MTEKPKNVIYIDEIKSIEEKYKKKKNHFNVVLKNGKNLHLKCDKVEDMKNWVDCLNSLKQIYDGKKLVDFDINRKYKDQIDVRVMNLIMEEHEKNYMDKISPKLNFNKPLTAKGIKSYYDSLSPGFRKNRVMMGFVKKTVGKQVSNNSNDDNNENNADMINLGNKFVLPETLTFWDDNFCILFSSKAIPSSFEEGENLNMDFELLQKEKIPNYLELDTLYFFNYSGKSDDSKPVASINGK